MAYTYVRLLKNTNTQSANFFRKARAICSNCISCKGQLAKKLINDVMCAYT